MSEEVIKLAQRLGLVSGYNICQRQIQGNEGKKRYLCSFYEHAKANYGVKNQVIESIRKQYLE